MPVRVLLADRDSRFLQLCRKELARERITVKTAATGLECLAMLRSSAPDALVLDPDLLWGGGLGVLAAMGEDPDLAGIPVIVVCDHEGNGSFSKLDAPQVREYCTKPVSLPTLARTIHEVVASAKGLVLSDRSSWLG